VWHRAESLLLSEYAFAGTISGRRVIETVDLDYRTEPPPMGLKRVVEPGQGPPPPPLAHTWRAGSAVDDEHHESGR
jgi:hypothetical protein